MAALKVSDVIDVGEPDYMYGTGRLLLRVTRVGAVQRLADGSWLDLEGLTLRLDGTQVDSRPRHVLVRLSAVRIRGQRPGGQP